MNAHTQHAHRACHVESMTLFVIGILVGVVGLAALLNFTAPAYAAPDPTYPRWSQPYGGCDEAWQAPRSTGADECRDHGWTVHWWIVVSPKDRVAFVDPSINQCANEDAGRFCTWNFDVPRSHGEDLWYGGHGGRHYVKQVQVA